MKYITFVLLFFFSFYLCKKAENESVDRSMEMAELEEKFGKTESKLQDSPEELEKRRQDNEEKLKQKIKNYLKEIGLESETKITRAQFKDLFFNLLEFDKNKEKVNKNEGNEKKEENISFINRFANQIFDILVSKDLEYIDIDSIDSFFDTKNILNAFKEILKSLGLESLIDAFSGPLMESFGNISNNDNNINTTKSANITNFNNEKNSDL